MVLDTSVLQKIRMYGKQDWKLSQIIRAALEVYLKELQKKYGDKNVAD